MYRILVWGVGYGYGQYINLLKYQELLGEIEIIGVTGKDILYDRLDGYPFLSDNQIREAKADYVVVTSDLHFNEIAVEAGKLQFGEDKLIMAKVFALPGFLFSQYALLLHSKVSIIANNCWGGTAYHALGMRFYSPFINMFEDDENFLRLLGDFKYYMGLKLEFVRYGFSPARNIIYPVCRLGDVELHFNHFSSMDEVERKWYERVERINWDNLFVMMHTENVETMGCFEKLRFDKKICFVPFSCSLQSAYCLQLADRNVTKNEPFWSIVNKTAGGNYHDYNLIDLLLSGKVNRNRYF